MSRSSISDSAKSRIARHVDGIAIFSERHNILQVLEICVIKEGESFLDMLESKPISNRRLIELWNTAYNMSLVPEGRVNVFIDLCFRHKKNDRCEKCGALLGLVSNDCLCFENVAEKCNQMTPPIVFREVLSPIRKREPKWKWTKE